jgi:hypothetical protein
LDKYVKEKGAYLVDGIYGDARRFLENMIMM